MHKVDHFLLTIDAVINMILGIVLLFFPLGLDQLLGLPIPINYFYTTVLGGVLLGIGIALLQERLAGQKNIRGLGLNGAIVINFCGASVLIFWLVFSDLNIPVRGIVLLWAIVILVFIIGILELTARSGN